MGRIDDPKHLSELIHPRKSEKPRVIAEPIFVSFGEWDYQLTPFGVFRKPKNSDEDYERIDNFSPDELKFLSEEINTHLNKSES